jgi:hypothetical protein
VCVCVCAHAGVRVCACVFARTCVWVGVCGCVCGCVGVGGVAREMCTHRRVYPSIRTYMQLFLRVCACAKEYIGSPLLIDGHKFDLVR